MVPVMGIVTLRPGLLRAEGGAATGCRVEPSGSDCRGCGAGVICG